MNYWIMVLIHMNGVMQMGGAMMTKEACLYAIKMTQSPPVPDVMYTVCMPMFELPPKGEQE